MSFDEFRSLLSKYRYEFRKIHGRDMETIHDLDKHLDMKLLKKSRLSTGAKSLRGMKF